MGWHACIQCRERFGLAEATEATLIRSGQTFHCPWGHPQVFTSQPTDAELLRKERDTLKQQLAYKDDRIRAEVAHREAAQNQARAFKGVATRIKNRVSKGVCPCCNRSFANLAAHMATKHGGYQAEEIVADGATIQ